MDEQMNETIKRLKLRIFILFSFLFQFFFIIKAFCLPYEQLGKIGRVVGGGNKNRHNNNNENNNNKKLIIQINW